MFGPAMCALQTVHIPIQIPVGGVRRKLSILRSGPASSDIGTLGDTRTGLQCGPSVSQASASKDATCKGQHCGPWEVW